MIHPQDTDPLACRGDQIHGNNDTWTGPDPFDGGCPADTEAIGLAAAFRMMGVEIEPHKATPVISGMLMTVHQGERDGRDLWMVVGVVAAPKGTFKDFQRMPFYGAPPGDCFLDMENSTLHPECLGMGAAGILTSPLWSV